MTSFTKQEGNTVRPMTELEQQQYEQCLMEMTNFAEKEQAAAAARASAIAKLEALGLSAAEVAALVGQ